MSKNRWIALFTLVATHAVVLLPGTRLTASAQPNLPRQFVGYPLIAQSSSTLVETVDRIAQAITVRISSLSSGYGSGVLVAKQGSTYFVLTAEHVVPKPDSYTILAPDGKSYPVIAQKITKLEGIDLALLQFSSPQSYQIATLANYYVGPESRPLAFLSGFPGANATASRQLTVGTVFPSTATLFAAQSAYSTASGRELVYTAFSQPGMSGGPILDTQGRVIGIHNASETKLEADATTGEVVPIYLGRSLGVPISTFLGRVPQRQVDPTLLKLENDLPPSLSQATLRAVLDDRLPAQPSGNVTPSEWLAYGNRLWRLGHFRDAQQALERALQLKPDFYQALYVKGLTLLSQDQFSEAIAAFDATLQIEPRFYEALRMKAQMLERLKRYSEALATIEQAIQIEPKDPLLYSLKGDFLYQLQQYNAATSAYTQALDLKPAYYIYMQRGRSHFSEGNYQRAYSDYDQAIAQQPNDYFSYMARGTMNSMLGKSQAALEDFQQALQSIPTASPYKPILYLSRGLEYFSRRNLEAAIADWTMALNTSIPGSTSPEIMAEIYTSRALAYSQSKDLPKAIADMGKLIDLQPRNATAFYNRGDFYLQAGDPQRAILDLNQAIALQPNNADAIQTRGVAKQALKDFAGATNDFKQAVDLLNITIAKAPNNINTANAYIRRANARLGLGNKQGAIEDIQVVAQLLQQAGMTQGVMYQTVQKMLTLLQP
ncbi:MAG TPA: tetratricopeptide repeat protein [Stenomitos sp.]